MIDYTLGLNPEQKRAVETTEGPVLILAGAGSGKTRVITHRISHLVENCKVDPFRVLAVTFTNKAALEMKHRIEMLVPEHYRNLLIRTFHSLCLYILRREYKEVGLEKNFTVYDTEMSEQLIKEILKEMGMDLKVFKPANILSAISRSKDNLISLEEFVKEWSGDEYEKTIAKVYQVYEHLKEKRNALDFGDLITRTVKYFRERERLRNKYSSLWNYIMVDEYQDTNKAQYELIQLLSKNHGNLCVVGDDDQSIYSWRGALVENILNFANDHTGCTIIKLEENYRSSGNIIETASNLIQFNKYRSNKTIFTANAKGDLIQLKEFENELEESESVIKEILKLKSEKKLAWTDFAVFYRTNAQSRYFEESLRKKNIPYRIFGGVRFYDRKEIKDLIAYLQVLVNPLDSTSLKRILNEPPRGIGEATEDKLMAQSLDEGISLFETLERPFNGIKPNVQKKIKDLHSLFSILQKKLEEKEKPSLLAYAILEQSGMRSDLEKEMSEESVSRLENLNEFINSLIDYENANPDASLEEYLNSIALITSGEENANVVDYVTLMTIHNSKGLEFTNVFLAGLEEGTFPHMMSMDSDGGLEEERRLCYVAITRAKERLFMSFNRVTRKFGNIEHRMPSRFIEELPTATVAFQSVERGEREPSHSPLAKFSGKSEKFEEPKSLLGKDFWREGQKVRHKTYGIGKILVIEGKGDNTKATILFGNVSKKFLLAYTPLDSIS